MKKSIHLILVSLTFLFIVGCQTNVNPTPTITVAPTETVEPTVEPVITEVPVVEPTEVPTVEPTEVPVEVPTETPACTHEDTYDFLAEETMEEYKYQVICNTCGEIVAEYTVEKEVPEAKPTATPTPLPTSTPTPLPTATPVPTKAPCNHEETATRLKEETDTEYINEVICENCNEVIEVFTIPKATPTPTPRPTEKPLPTPTPVPNRAEVVKEYTTKSGHYVIEYADLTSLTVWKEGSAPHSVGKYETPIFYMTYYDADDYITSEEYLARYVETSSDEVIEYYMCSYYDGETKTWTSRLVNSDGSFNRYSENVIDGLANVTQVIYGYDWNKDETELVPYLKSISFGEMYAEDYVIYTGNFIYHENGIIRLYEY